MSEDRRPTRYPQSTLLEVAMVSNVTFNSWRKRNFLFPWTNEDRKWNSYTGAEISVARTVVILTNCGLTASKAVSAAMALLPIYRGAWESNPALMVDHPIFVLREGVDGAEWSALDPASQVGKVFIADDSKLPAGVMISPARVVLEVMVGIHKVQGMQGIGPLLDAINPQPHESYLTADMPAAEAAGG